jgi:hypothetical protein
MMRQSVLVVLSFAALILAACSGDNAKTPDGGTIYTSAPPNDISCNTDSDCCVAIDACHSIAYVVHAGDSLQIPQTNCNLCIAPPVQVWCSSGKCQSATLPISPSTQSFMTDHCGSLALPDDAGAVTSSDAGAHGCQ